MRLVKKLNARSLMRGLHILYGVTKAELGRAEWTALPGQKTLENQNQGWSHESIVNIQVKKWEALNRELVTNPTALMINHEAPQDSWGDDLFFQNQILCFGHALALASAGRKRLSWLDYGGGLGQYGFYAKALYPDLIQNYTCFDLPLFREAAAKLNLKGRYLSDKKATLSGKYDLIFAGSSLWYDDTWKDTLGQMAGSGASYLMVARQLMVEKAPSFVVQQQASRHGYLTQYQAWVLNQSEFLETAREKGLELVRKYYLNDMTYVHRAIENPRFVSYLFKRKMKKT
jgi:putative methyltransferase (TIGR04325 family)